MYLFISHPILSHKKSDQRKKLLYLFKQRYSKFMKNKIKEFRLGVVSVGHSVMSDSLQPHPMDCSMPGSSFPGILQARILEWVAIPFSTGSSQPRAEPRSPALQADSLPYEAPGKPRGSEG